MTTSELLLSVNIALTDELRHRIESGYADVYYDADAGAVRVAVWTPDASAPAERHIIKVYPHPSEADSRDWETGNWIQTYSGRRFDLANPDPADVDITDIAHALSQVNRFTGHTREPYSVAQHSLLVSTLLAYEGAPAEVQYAGLLHDAPEAYVTDVSRPLKRMLPVYQVIESDVTRAVNTALDVPDSDEIRAAVRRADDQALRVERRDLLAPVTGEPLSGGLPDIQITPRDALTVREHFLQDYRRLREALANA